MDLRILVPGAIGTLLTGLVYSIWTHWDWFKHRWSVVMWCICIFGIVFGTFQACTVICAMAISTLKPWKKRTPGN